ncbi:hypothetical protein K493DRAFT_311978 [Basidiobolus meristosporus CBS 931.73]|uniref:Yeast cell wall synthesis Kre9/Knh1-like N-terminal domain-containing protein n=1 Tax=Basidiobolus meristosporus CBS 931.73 TaxID=1314790 RepID=A0A1Y1YY55_9FUNG|nr:hypothetical protein K493DRAFT_311978 [Basidiobolus meristosporus CBS 931.73]|eukprot:ORY02814.1 hypothetical protein K493DRAFT_311978 [Basidiobolus meristosporus CBS 931.73]
MFSKTLASVAAVALLAASASADYSIVEPVEGTKWVAGETVTIRWIEIPGTPTPEKLSLALMAGEATRLQVSQVIADVDSKAGSYKWTVPSTVQPGAQYAVRAGTGDAVKYSHYFDVEGGKVPGASSSASATNASKSGTLVTPIASSNATSVASSATPASNSTTIASTSLVSPTSSIASSIISSGASSKPTSAATSAPSKVSPPATPSPSKTPASAGSNLAISAISALIPAALVAYMRQ